MPIWPQILYVVKGDLELLICLSLRYWDFRHACTSTPSLEMFAVWLFCFLWRERGYVVVCIHVNPVAH